MALACARGPGEHDGARRPVRPGLDQSERRCVRRAAQEILTRVALRMIEREGKLARTVRIGHGTYCPGSHVRIIVQTSLTRFGRRADTTLGTDPYSSAHRLAGVDDTRAVAPQR